MLALSETLGGGGRSCTSPSLAADLGMQEDRVAALLLGLRLLIKNKTITAKSLNEEPLSVPPPTEATDDSQPPADGATHDSQQLASTGDHGTEQQTTSAGSTDSPGAAPKTGGGTAAPDQGAQVIHDSQKPAESAAGDHGTEQQTTSAGSTDSPGAAPKTGGGTAAPDQGAQASHDSQKPAESAAADSQQLAEGATDDSQPLADGAEGARRRKSELADDAAMQTDDQEDVSLRARTAPPHRWPSQLAQYISSAPRPR